MNNYHDRSMRSADPRYLTKGNKNFEQESADEQLRRRRNQVRDALNRTKNIAVVEKIAEILRV